MVRKSTETIDVNLPPPAKTLEGREHQLVAAAFDLVERRIAEGTASAQETVHFLKLGTTTHRLEQDKLRQENAVLQTRVKEMESRQGTTADAAAALRAFRGYAGHDPMEDEDEDPYLQ